ncbi:GNAT family N-acetyltransferase [Bacillus cereus]|nr:GNAT family N-acetyltransferase [Bacillus cereus]
MSLHHTGSFGMGIGSKLLSHFIEWAKEQE